MKNTRFRAPLKNVKGLGAAKAGTGHFINQRVSAMALIPLVFLFMYFLLRMVTAGSYDDIVAQVSNPFWATVLIAFILVGFYHGALGMQVIIEDYIHEEMPKMLLLTALRLAAGFLAIMGVLSVLFIALTH
ncbi:MAG: succinate dehydrogenase, hydrophobic membrane anchor protein [Gammaproteobacteria bacterium]|nr:MAG: succinate dehydrogenase, hydrophobic membrane anchor protein [Gammaproteobacteria bacterium]